MPKRVGGSAPPSSPKKPARRKPAQIPGAPDLSKKKTPLRNPETAPFKPGTASFRERQRQARIAKIQGPPAPPPRDVQAQPQQVAANWGYSPGFAGVTKGNAPAKKNVPNLTAQVALARARKQRLQHGGLLTPVQRAAETEAAKYVETNPGFAGTPPPGRVALPQRSATRPTTTTQVTPRTGGVAGKSGVIYSGTPQPQGAPFGSAGKWLGKNVLEPAHKYADEGFATGLRDTFTTLTGVGGTSMWYDLTHPGHLKKTVDEQAKKGWQSSAEVADEITKSHMKRPDVKLPVGWLNFEGTAYAGTKLNPKARIPFADLEDTGFGLTPAGKAALTQRALKVTHWNPGDVEGISANELIYKAYNKPPNLLERIAEGAGKDILLGGSNTVGFLGAGSEILQGRGVQTLKDFGEQGREILPVFGKHPFGQELLAHPLFAAAAAHGLAHGAGSIGHLKPGEGIKRDVKLAGVTDREGNRYTVDKGRYSKNLVKGAEQKIGDVLTSHSTRRSNKILRQDVIDKAITDIRDGVAPEHIALQVPYKQGMENLKPHRAEQLLAHAAWGGRPGLQDAALHFRRLAEAGGKDAEHYAAWADFLEKTAADTAELSKPDQEYLHAIHQISGHTTQHHMGLGQFGDVAAKYRRYELPIEHAAAIGDPVAQNAIAARHAYQDALEADVPNDAHRRGVLRTLKSQAKKAEAEYGRFERQSQAGSAEHSDWVEEGKRLRKERPTLPKLEQPGPETFSTLKEASAAAKDRPGVTVKKEGDSFVVHDPEAPKAKHPPGTMGPHRAAVKEWKARYNEWKAREPTVSKGREHSAAAKARNARSRADELNARIEAMDKGAPVSREDAIAAATAQYSDAVDQFAAQHNAREGATEPAYVPYTKPPSGLRRVRRTAGKHRFTPKLDKQRASTGKTAYHGEFMLDPKSLLHANAEVQRMRANVGVFRLLENHPFVERAKGDGELRVPEGKVAVPVTNMRSTVETMPEWDSTPVGMHEFTEREHKLRTRIVEAMGSGSQQAGEIIPAGKDVFLVPKGMHDRIEEWAKPGTSQGFWGAYDRANAAYQRLLIGLYPSTWMGNAPGSIPLAFASGAVHPMDYVRAQQASKLNPFARNIKQDAGHVPDSIRGLGPAGATSPGTSINPLMMVARFGRGASQLGEDLSAAASYFGQTRTYVEGHAPVLRKMAPALDKVIPAKWKGRAAELNVSASDLYHALASGKWKDGELLHEKDRAKRDAAIERVQEFMSASGRPVGGIGKVVGRGILFQSWLGHILKLSVMSLPLNHPIRATFLNTVSLYGNQYRQEHGVYPDWMMQFLPILRDTRMINGQAVPGVLSMGQGQLTPISSGANLAQAGSNILNGNGQDPFQAAASVLSPVLQPFAQAILQYQRNALAGPGEKTYNPFAVGFARGVYTIPGLAKPYPTSGFTPTSFPGHMTKRQYYEYVPTGQKGTSYKRYPIPWNMRSGGRPLTGALGIGSRLFGLPLEWSPTGGRPLQIENSNNVIIESANARKRDAAKYKAHR